jgi:hypothetical protein
MVLCLRLMRCFHAHVPRTLFLTRYKLPLQMRSSAGVARRGPLGARAGRNARRRSTKRKCRPRNGTARESRHPATRPRPRATGDPATHRHCGAHVTLVNTDCFGSQCFITALTVSSRRRQSSLSSRFFLIQNEKLEAHMIHFPPPQLVVISMCICALGGGLGFPGCPSRPCVSPQIKMVEARLSVWRGGLRWVSKALEEARP